MHTNSPVTSVPASRQTRVPLATLLVSNRVTLLNAGFVLLIAAVGVLLTMQGWKSRVPAFDLLTYIYSGRDFLAHGTLPQHGDTGSYGSYKPPGTTWLMLPSMLLFDDPRLSEYVGTALLHIATLAGIFLLARHYFGTRCAYLSVVLYGLSHHGLFLAGSLWPNGRPDFYVWIAYLTTRWVSDRDGRFLAGAVTIWAIGMHVDMAIAPAIFILAAAWLYYRPPLRLRPLLAGAMLALLVWSPYLQFETDRGFADLKSQLLLQKIPHGDYRASWCDSDLTLLTWQAASTAPTSIGAQLPDLQSGAHGPLDALLRLGRLGSAKLVSNFQAVAPVPGADYALLLITLTSIASLSVAGDQGRWPAFLLPRYVRDRRLSSVLRAPIKMLLPAIAGLGIVAVVALVLLAGPEQFGGTAGLVSRAPKLIATSMIVALTGIGLVMAVQRALAHTGVVVQTADRAEKVWMLTLSLVIPWSVLLLVAEPGKPERFWWLWSIQVIFLAAFMTEVLPRVAVPPGIIWIASAVVIAIVVANPFLRSRVDSWLDDGWPGRDAEEVQVADFVASDLRAVGKDEAAIGYQILIFPFMANYNITNDRYKVGAEFDLMFRFRNQIGNTDTCAEGVSLTDEYRIVQTRPKPWDGSPREHFDVPLDSRYQLIGEVASYRVFKRDSSSAVKTSMGINP